MDDGHVPIQVVFPDKEAPAIRRKGLRKGRTIMNKKTQLMDIALSKEEANVL